MTEPQLDFSYKRRYAATAHSEWRREWYRMLPEPVVTEDCTCDYVIEPTLCDTEEAKFITRVDKGCVRHGRDYTL